MFTCTALLSLALGAGASTAVFGLVDALLVKALPVVRPEEIVQLVRGGGGSSSYPEYRALRSASQQFTQVFGVSTASSQPIEIRADGSTQPAFLQVVTDN
jgi:hypothetical protein